MPVPVPVTDKQPEQILPLHRIGLWPKLAYTAFVVVQVPFYLISYGPTDFLYFCDMALFIGLAALWTEIPLLAAMPAVGIVVPQIIWCADFIGELCGMHMLRMTEYMFDPGIPLVARGLSLFHGWLPFVLVWMVYKLGYDRRALWSWTLAAWAAMLVCFFFTAVPPAPANNPNLPVDIDYVFGISSTAPQTWMAPWQWLALLMVALPVCIWLPTHLVLKRLMPEARQ